jgi:hypothetical protein
MLSVRQTVRSAKCPFGKMSVRQNVRSAKRPSAKCPFGKMSFGKMSFGKVSAPRIFQVVYTYQSRSFLVIGTTYTGTDRF